MTEDECRKEIGKLKRLGLVSLLAKIRSNSVPAPWSPGKAFEYLVVRSFEVEKLDVSYPFPVNLGGRHGTDEQVDGSVLLDGTRFLIESKDWDKNLDYTPIAKLVAQLTRRPPATMGLVFAADFTGPALELTRRTGPIRVLLWTASDLELAVKMAGGMKRALAVKYRRAQELGVPDATLTPMDLK